MNFRTHQKTFVRLRSGAASRKRAKTRSPFSRGSSASGDRFGASKPYERRNHQEYAPKTPRTAEKNWKDSRKNSRRVYFDPSNLSLDFEKPNHVILDEILANSEHRTRLRSHVPAEEWESQHGSNLKKLRQETKNMIRGARVSLKKNLTPLGLGDVVLLNFHSTELHLVAAEPQGLTSSMFTFVNSLGEVLQGTKHMVKLRIPKVLSRDTVKALNLISEERKHPGMDPIGIPEKGRDKSESRGSHDYSAPEVSPASEHDLVVAQAQAQLLTNTDVLTYIVPYTAREVYSQYLRQISIEAFQKVTTFSSKLDYMHNVLQYDQGNNIITSVQTLSVFELFNYVCDFKTTLKVVEQMKGSRDEYRDLNQHIRFPPGTGISDACVFSGLALPENTRENFAYSSHKVSSYIAFMIALSRSSRMWKINTQMSSKTPLSVDILPVNKGLMVTSTIDLLKQPKSIQEFASAYVHYMQDPSRPFPRRFEPVVQMLKDFVAENIVNDTSMESFAGKVVRAVDDRVGKRDGPAYTAEYSKSRAYDIIVALSNVAETNPAYWNESLGLPGTGTSRDSDSFATYFRYVDSEFPTRESVMGKLLPNREKKPETVETQPNPETEIQTETSDTNSGNENGLSAGILNDFYHDDPVRHVRTDFGSVPVYCIDSATAHEIDDGISIQPQRYTYKITVHVANPTSYLKPESILSQIAFKKGATVYMPEGPSMMLPQLMSRLCGLNGTSKKTRTISIEYTLDKQTVDRYISASQRGNTEVDDEMAHTIMQDMKQSSNIRFYHVSNFPKGFTYETVNSVLKANQSNFEAGRLRAGSHEDNLFKLYHISCILKHIRVKLGHGILLNGEKSRVSVTHETGLQKTEFRPISHGWTISVPRPGAEQTPVISVVQEINQNNESQSQQLVSEHMIGANYAGAQYAQKHQIPFIHRTQELDLSLPARNEMRRIMQRVYAGRGELSIEETSQILSVMTSANFEVSRKKHESLGLEIYSNLTSPLRRYVDMVNHWNVQEYVSDSHPKFRQAGDLDYIANRLQISEAITKNAVRKSEAFWMGKFLERYFTVEPKMAEKERMRFSVLLRSNAKTGDVRAELVGFGSMRLSIVSDENVRSKFASGDFYIGKVLEDVKFRVVKLDCIENDLTIELLSCK